MSRQLNLSELLRVAYQRRWWLVVPVASLEDVIRSKETANRPKDRLQLPLLRKLLDER